MRPSIALGAASIAIVLAGALGFVGGRERGDKSLVTYAMPDSCALFTKYGNAAGVVLATQLSGGDHTPVSDGQFDRIDKILTLRAKACVPSIIAAPPAP